MAPSVLMADVSRNGAASIAEMETFLSPYVGGMLSFASIPTTHETARWLASDGTIALTLLPSFDFETDCELAADTVRCEHVLSATCHLAADVCAVSICPEWCRL